MSEKAFQGILLRQVLLIGMLYMGDYLFFFFESNYFNTYLDHVLYLPELYISTMVSLSALVGLISMYLWGIISDNTRSKFGRRRPYLLFGIIAGIGMIIYSFAFPLFGRTLEAYIWCLIIDVVIIGFSSNAYLVAERALIPDTIEIEKRGRANGIINSISYIGLLIGVAFLLLGNELFGVPDPRDTTPPIGTIIPESGHFILLFFGGIVFLIVSIIGFLFIRERPVSELSEKKKFFAEIKQTFNITELRTQKEFYKMLIAFVIFQSGIASVMPFLFIFIFGLGLSTVNLLIGIAIAFPILFLVTLYLGKVADKAGRKKYVPLAIIIVSIGFMIMPFAGLFGSILLFMISLPFVLVGILALVTPLNAWTQDLLPKDKRGKFTGIFNVVNTLSQIIGSFAGGIISMIFGISWIFVLGPVFFLISIPLFMRVAETVKRD